MYLQSTSAWSAAHGAAEAADVGAKNAGLLSRVANAYASDAYFTCAAQNLQVHGGIGFTWEHDAHLHLKRARADRSLLGTPSHHLETIAAHLLD
jgi:acyl-CoA dehydrogenase